MAMKARIQKSRIGNTLPDEINLVRGENLAVSRFVLPGLSDIDHTHDHVGPLHRPFRPFDPFAFEGVFGFTQSCSVRDPEGNPPQACEFLDCVAGGSRGGAHDGPIEPKKPVEKAGFSGIRWAAENQADPFAEDTALLGSRQQGFDPATGLPDLSEELFARVRVNAFFGEIDGGFEMRDNPEEKTSDLLDLAAEAACELFLGRSQGK